MKVFEISYNEKDFVNKKSSHEHLFKVQQARCYEFLIYATQLSHGQYDATEYLAALPTWKSSLISPSMSAAWFANTFPWLRERTPHEQQKLKTKFDRVLAAKKEYEEAAGKYAYRWHI